MCTAPVSVLRILSILLVALGAGAPAVAATIGFVPGEVDPAPGDSFQVGIVIGDLGGEYVSAYDLDIVFDPAVLRVDLVTQEHVLGHVVFGEATYDAATSPGLVDIAGTSLLPDIALQAYQDGNTVVLGTIAFSVIGNGGTTLDFVFDATNDVKGLEGRILDLDVEPARIGEVVPEPATAVSFGGGLLLMAWFARRRRFRALRR